MTEVLFLWKTKSVSQEINIRMQQDRTSVLMQGQKK